MSSVFSTQGTAPRPPAGFVPITVVHHAEYAAADSAPTQRLKGTRAQRAGVKYERAVRKAFEERFPFGVEWHPWLRFMTGSKQGWLYCQPDCILHFAGFSVVVEVKAGHSETAWWQLRRKYQPVVQRLLKPKPIFVTEVCKSYDPRLAYPETCSPYFVIEEWLEKLHHMRDAGDDCFPVLQWRP